MVQQDDNTKTETQWTRNALEVLHLRYLQPEETPDRMLHRVARHIAQAETTPELKEEWSGKFFRLMRDLKFLPNTPTLAHAGVPDSNHCLSACFVDSPHDNLESILEVCQNLPIIEASGGGMGFGLSRIRPHNDRFGISPDGACGPIRILHHLSSAGNTFTQGAIRQGAHMAQLHITHPDILEFIHCKDKCLTPQDPLSNFNISVQIPDWFMKWLRAPRDEVAFTTVNPRVPMEDGQALDVHEVWRTLCEEAWRTGDPGVVFWDRIEEASPNRNLGEIRSSNPCGEEFLEDGSSCNLGSINLAAYFDPDSDNGIDYGQLMEDIYTCVRFLDDVIDVNQFPIPKFQEMNRLTRRIGLGVMGWADLLVLLGLKYDSDEAVELAEVLSRFITTHAWDASARLATEKGPFPNWEESSLRLERPNDSALPTRNSSVTCVAPTGSISILAGCSSGIEPHYALMWERPVIWHQDGSSESTIIEVPAPFRDHLEKHWRDVWRDVSGKDRIGTSDTFDDFLSRLYFTPHAGIPINKRLGRLADVLCKAHDISPEYHVRHQAAWQKHFTNGVSKTINLPESATVEDISQAFILAWELGCKAVTVYRDKSKTSQILNTHTEDDIKHEHPHIHSQPKPRPKELPGTTYHVRTGHGSWFFTINTGEDGLPTEVFLTPGESNTCVRAGAEAVGKLISVALRSGIDVQSIIRQLRETDCGHTHWDQGQCITSVYDALARVLEQCTDINGPHSFLSQELGRSGNQNNGEKVSGVVMDEFYKGDSPHAECPKCSQVAMIHSGGCDQCLACGYNSCG